MEYWWKYYPWRMVQTNLREIDMADIDASRYVASLKDLHATVAMINVAGIIASYPTDLPFHFQSEFLQGDSLQDVIAACHSADIRVVARTDFSKVRRPIYEQHPEWASRYGDGIIEDYNGDVHCCINGDYQRKFAPRIIEEAVTKLDVDGIFFNMGGYLSRNYSYANLGLCRCDNCQTRFREMYDLELPVTESSSDVAFGAYQEFKSRTVDEHRRLIISTIRKVRPDIAIDRDTVNELGFYRQESNTEIGRSLPHWQYNASENTKRVVTSYPDLVSSNTTVDFLGFYQRHVSVQSAQQALRLWQNLANCGGLDYYLIGRLDNHRDRSGFESVKRVFSYHETHFESTYVNLVPVAEVLLIAGGENQGEYRGWYRILTESHTLFAVGTLDRIDSIDISIYAAIVLPDIRRLSQKSEMQFEGYVREGGTIIASGETGLYAENEQSPRSGPVPWLGVLEIKTVRNDMRSAILSRSNNDTNTRSNDGFAEDRELIAIGDTFVFAEYEAHSDFSLRLIPPHNYGPPERCYWTIETDLPGLVRTKIGDGTSIHIPWKPGEFYHREGYDNTSSFVSEVLETVSGSSGIKGNLSEMVEVTLATGNDADRRSFYLIQLVNGSGHFGNSYFEPVSMYNIELSVEFSDISMQAETLSGETVEVSATSDGRYLICLRVLNQFEAIKLYK